MNKKVGVVDYGMGNLTSVINALLYLGKEPEIADTPDKVSSYETLILPGVGAFGKAMSILNSKGLVPAIKKSAGEGKNILGICLGMQLLFSKSYEFGVTEGLNLIEGSVLPFDKGLGLKVPHMGWNNISSTSAEYSPHDGDYYFVHSFYCKPDYAENSLFTANYGIDFCAGVKKGDNVLGLQFHPEKSQKNGISLLENILEQW